MKKEFLEAGQIVNTHGLRGEVRILPWADSPGFLQSFEHLYIDGQSVKLLGSRVHKHSLIAQLEGVTDINAAIALKHKMVYIRRAEADLPPGHFFIQDILGAKVVDEAGMAFGKLQDILPRPAGDVYVIVREGGQEHLVPDVPAFILEKNPDEGFIRVRLIEGM